MGWWIAGLGLVGACAGLTLFVIGNRSHPPALPGDGVQEGQRVVAQPAAGTNQPSGGPATTAKAGPEAGEDRVVTLITEGNRSLGRGSYAEAAGSFQEALRLEPGSEDLHYNLAIALAKLGRNEEAKKEYAEALEIYPEYADAHNNLGNLLMTEGRMEEAIDHFQEALRAMPDNAPFRNNLGTAFGRLGRVSEAIEAFAEAVRLKPAYLEARVNLANACLASGRVEEAVTQLEETLRLKPGFEPAVRAMNRARQRSSSSGAPR